MEIPDKIGQKYVLKNILLPPIQLIANVAMFVYQIEFLFNPFCYNSCFSCLPNGLPRIIGNIPTVSFMSFPVLRYHISYLFRCENFNFHCNQRQMNVEHISLTCKCFIINSRYRIIFECFLWANSIHSSPPPFP